MLRWLRSNPVSARLAIRLAAGLTAGGAVGLLAGPVCDLLELSRTIAALAAATTAIACGTVLADRIADRLGIAKPEA